MKKTKKKPGPKPKPTSHHDAIMIRMKPDLRKKCEMIVKHMQFEGREIETRSDMIRQLIRDYHVPVMFQ